MEPSDHSSEGRQSQDPSQEDTVTLTSTTPSDSDTASQASYQPQYPLDQTNYAFHLWGGLNYYQRRNFLESIGAGDPSFRQRSPTQDSTVFRSHWPRLSNEQQRHFINTVTKIDRGHPRDPPEPPAYMNITPPEWYMEMGTPEGDKGSTATGSESQKQAPNLQEDVLNSPRPNTESLQSIMRRILREELSRMGVKGPPAGNKGTTATGTKEDRPVFSESEKEALNLQEDVLRGPRQNSQDATRDRGAMNQPTSDGEESLVSYGTSIFEQNPVKLQLHQLRKVLRDSHRRRDQFPEHRELLEQSRDSITKVLDRYEKEARTFPRIAPAEMDELCRLADEVDEERIRLCIMIGDLQRESQERRNMPRIVYPQFSGNALDFLSFQKEMDSAMKYLTDNQKRTSYRKAMTGENRREILDHLSRLFRGIRYLSIAFLFNHN